MGGDNVDNLAASVFAVCAFVNDLAKFCGVATEAPMVINFEGLWLSAIFFVAGDSGGDLEVTQLGRGTSIVFGDNSLLVDTCFATALFGWDNFESAVSSTGDCWDLNGDIPLLCDVTTGTPKQAV